MTDAQAAQGVDAEPVQPQLMADQELPTESPSLPPAGPTRISGTWVGIIVAAVVLVLLLVFVLQNTQSVKVSYFSGHGKIPLGVVLILAAVGGVLFAGVVASLRILQIRRRLGSRQGQSVAPPRGERGPEPMLDAESGHPAPGPEVLGHQPSSPGAAGGLHAERVPE